MNNAEKQAAHFPVAIIGLACRTPGNVHSADALWEALRSGVSILERPQPQTTRLGAGQGGPCEVGRLPEVAMFDHEAFGISKRDAMSMDPQQRLLLEVVGRALQDAGEPQGRHQAGVFVATLSDDYRTLQSRRGPQSLASVVGTARGGACGAVSHAFGLSGPSMALDSDRSGGLVAVDMAARALRGGECQIAVVGASNLILTEELTDEFRRLGLLAQDGRTRFGDAGRTGFVRSEAVMAMVLKPLGAARADGDRIYATLRGSAVRHAGGATDDFLTPSRAAYEQAVQAALRAAEVSPDRVEFVEAHGAGSRVGDPIELAALEATYGQGRTADRPVLVGSIKGTLGHTEAASGLAGLFEAALALYHGEIPATLHAEHPCDSIDFDGLHVRISRNCCPFSSPVGERFAAVSSIGLTGTVAHAILEGPPAGEGADDPVRTELVLPVSARSEWALEERGRIFADRLAAQPDLAESLCRSAAQRSVHHAHRLAVVGRSASELVEGLREALQGGVGGLLARGVVDGRSPLIYVFSGHGSQWPRMGRALLESQPVFRDSFLACDELARREVGLCLVDEMLADDSRCRFADVAVVQPVLVAFQISLAALYQEFGLRPDAVVGASMGEISAAHVAGVLSRRDAMRVICRRAKLLGQVGGQGKMAVVECSSDRAQRMLSDYPDRAYVAGINSQHSVVIGGECDALDELAQRFEASAISFRFVKVNIASHCPSVATAARHLTEGLGDIRPQDARVPLYSTVIAKRVEGGDLGASYWGRNLREPVLLSGAVRQILMEAPRGTFLELSPHPVLLAPLLDNLEGYASQALASLKRDEDEMVGLLRSCGNLYVRGHIGRWQAFQGPASGDVCPPPHPLRRSFAWVGEEVESQLDPPVVASNSAWRDPDAALRVLVARLLVTDPGTLDARRPLRELGLTSLMLTELRSALSASLGRALPSALFFEYPTIEKLSAHLSTRGSSAEVPSACSSTSVASPSESRPAPGSIAVVGMASRFPGAQNLEAFWDLLHAGRDAVVNMKGRRWDTENGYEADPLAPDETYPRWAGLLESIDTFDAEFFNVTPREARAMDPHQRLLLEVSHAAIEHAGMRLDRLAGTATGVFVGMIANDDYATLKGLALDSTRIGSHDSTGDACSVAAGRLSYFYGFEGPSMTIDTACSSSLVATHLAIRSLRSGESDIALAAGVNLLLAPTASIAYSKTRMLSPRGRCRTFDAGADGYVRGEGCAVIVLKRAEDALRDGDEILALLRGSAVNQDGRSNGLTAPNGRAQQRVLEAALRDSGVAARDVDYLECHGTGTPLGDPIELRAAGTALGLGSRDRELVVGSVKTNIGHLEGAAGLAGLIKVVLAMRNQTIPAHLHFEKLNPEIEAQALLEIPTASRPWPARSGRRLAGVSSFGFSGTNGHVIVESALERKVPAAAEPDTRPQLLALSAHNEAALVALADRHATALADSVEADFAAHCFAAGVVRAPLDHRLAVVASCAGEARTLLGGEHQKPSAATLRGRSTTGRRPRVAFLFTGQGAQYADMARQLDEAEPVFRQAIDRCSEIARPWLNCALRDVLFGGPLPTDARLVQPAMFSIQYALVELWSAIGVRPDAVLGHSLGEYAACVAAGALALEDALRLVVGRGRVMSTLQNAGLAAAAWIRPEEADEFVAPYSGRASVAAYNGPRRVLIGGEDAAIRAIVDELRAAKHEAKILDGLIGVHSPTMDPIVEEMGRLGEGIEFLAPEIPYISGLEGRVVNQQDLADASYWKRHTRQPVRFMQGVGALLERKMDAFIEIGPRHTLLRLAEEVAAPTFSGLWLPSLSKEKHDRLQFLESAGALFCRGAELNFAAMHRQEDQRRLKLPSYQFQATRHWVSSAASVQTRPEARSLLGCRLRSSLPEVQFEALRSEAGLSSISGHKLFGCVVVPAAAYLARAMAGLRADGRSRPELVAVRFRAAMVLGEGRERTSHLVLSPQERGQRRFHIASYPSAEPEADFTVHVSGIAKAEAAPLDRGDALVSRSSCGDVPQQAAAAFYEEQERRGYDLGPALRRLEQAGVDRDRAFASFSAWDAASDAGLIALLDSCLQVATRFDAELGEHELLMPVGIERLTLDVAAASAPLVAQLRRREGPDALDLTVDISLYAEDEPIGEVEGIRLRRVSRTRLLGASRSGTPVEAYRVAWSPATRPDVSVAAATPPRRDGGFIVFGQDDAESAAVVGEIEALGERCTTVRMGKTFAAEADGYRLPVDCSQSWEALLEALADRLEGCRGLLYLWSMVDETPWAEVDVRCVRGWLGQQGQGLMQLLRELEARKAEPIPLWVVTKNAHRAQGEESGKGLLSSGLWGACRVLARELPGRISGLIDVPADAPADTTAERIIDEAWSGATAHCVEVGFRASERLASALLPVNLPKRSIAFSPEATYLVTGGLGGVGLDLARWMIDAGARHLVLLGRRVESKSRRVVDELCVSGVNVRALPLDVVDLSSVRRVIESLKASAPPVRGVMHAAGVLDDAPALDLSPHRIEEVIAPKVVGALNLHRVLHDTELDFFVLFSSVVGLIGNEGQLAYAMANAMLNRLAEERSKEGLPSLAVSFGPFRGKGMAEHVAADFERRWGLAALDRATAFERLGRLLSSRLPHAAIFDVDESALAQGTERGLLSTLAPPAGAPTQNGLTIGDGGVLSHILAGSDGDRMQRLTDHVRQVVGGVLGGVDGMEVSEDRRFEQLGVDSLLSTDIVRALQASIGMAVPSRAIFDHPTIGGLVEYLWRELKLHADEAPVASGAH